MDQVSCLLAYLIILDCVLDIVMIGGKYSGFCYSLEECSVFLVKQAVNLALKLYTLSPLW